MGSKRRTMFVYNKRMIIAALISWWYRAGWLHIARDQMTRLERMVDFFSIGALLKSLFAPYRQLSADKVQGALGVQLRAWADRQISRGIGAMVRLAVIVFGALATIVTAAIALFLLLVWPLLPLLPVIALMIVLGGRI